MALSTDDIFRLELKLRSRAIDFRREVETQPGSTPGLEAADAHKLADAKDFEATADILMALQADWPVFGSLVREGYKVEAARRDLNRKVSEAIPAPTEADEAA